MGAERIAIAGGTPEHAALATAFGAALKVALRGKPCRVYSSDLRLRVPHLAHLSDSVLSDYEERADLT